MGNPNIPYDEHALDLPADKEPVKVAGLWNYVEVLETDDAADSQEVSFNGGQSWGRLRKGIYVRIDGGTDDLQFRNPTGAPVVLAVAVGLGSFVDARLIVDASQGTVPVFVAGPHMGDGLPPVNVDINTIPPVSLGGPFEQWTGALRVREDDHWAVTATGYAAAQGSGAALASTDIVAAAANVNGVRIRAGGYFMANGSPGQCHLFGNDAVVRHIAGFSTPNNAIPLQHVLAQDVYLPAGIALRITIEGQYSYGFNYDIL